MFDPLPRVEDAEAFDAEVPAILFEVVDLARCLRIRHEPRTQRRSGIHMIDNSKRRFGTSDAPPCLPQSGKRLGAGVFVENVTIDIRRTCVASSAWMV